ncbi:MAG: hypothetical protein ABW148_04775 [Sedimenticola sp.]
MGQWVSIDEEAKLLNMREMKMMSNDSKLTSERLLTELGVLIPNHAMRNDSCSTNTKETHNQMHSAGKSSAHTEKHTRHHEISD